MRRWTRLGCTMLLPPLAFLPAPVTAAAREAAPADSLPSPPAVVRAWQSGTRPDRLEHAGLAFSIGLGAGLATRSPGLGAAGACGLGLLKELRDRRHGGFDPVDLAAAGLGAALAALATRAATR